MQTPVRRLKFLALSVIASVAMVSAFTAQADGQIQQGMNNDAWRVQQGLSTGALNSGQAAAIDGQLGQVQQQAQADRAMNGGHLTQQERQQLGSEMHAINHETRGAEYSNGYNANAMGNNNGMFAHHHHQYNGVMQPYNQGYPQQQMNNGYGNQYATPGYAAPYQQGYGGGMAPGGYGMQQNGYGNPYYRQQQQQQGGLMGGAGSLLQKLF